MAFYRKMPGGVPNLPLPRQNIWLFGNVGSPAGGEGRGETATDPRDGDRDVVSEIGIWGAALERDEEKWEPVFRRNQVDADCVDLIAHPDLNYEDRSRFWRHRIYPMSQS